MSWETLTMPKEAGGLGLTSIRHRNQAILMHQAWRLYTNSDMLWARVLKAKYFPHSSMFNGTRGVRGSHIWTAFRHGIKLLCEGMSWIVGDGQDIQIWQDSWLPHGTLRSYIEGPLQCMAEDSRVSSLRSNHSWTFESLTFPLPPHLEQLIQGIPVAQISRLSDYFLWPHNNGICSIKSASKFLYHKHQVPWDKQNWSWIWAVPCPKKNQLFLWKAMHNRLPTNHSLAITHRHPNGQCPRCHSLETTIHILRDCPWVKEAWIHSPGILPLTFFHMPLQAWLRSNSTGDTVMPPTQLPWHTYFPYLCWKLWLARNDRIFNNKSRS